MGRDLELSAHLGRDEDVGFAHVIGLVLSGIEPEVGFFGRKLEIWARD